MATFVQIIEELKESMFDLQVEQDETTQAIKSLDGRMAEFVALAGRDRLEDLEDRRESKRASQKQVLQKLEDRKNAKKGIGGLSIGDLAQAYLQGRLGMALLSGLGALLVSPIGLGILAGVATATVAGLGLSAFLKQAQNFRQENLDPPTEEETAKLDTFIEDLNALPSGPERESQAKKLTRDLALSGEFGDVDENPAKVVTRILNLIERKELSGEDIGNFNQLYSGIVAQLAVDLERQVQMGGNPTESSTEPVDEPFSGAFEDNKNNRTIYDLVSGLFDPKSSPFETKADITSRLIRTQEKKVMKAVEDDQGQIDVMATAAQYLTPDPAKAVSAEEFMKPASTMSRGFGQDTTMSRGFGQDIIGPIVETAIKSLRTDDNLGLGFFGAPNAGLDINELRDMNLDVEKLSIEIPPNLGGQVLSILGEGLNVGGTTVINNQTTNNVSGGGGGGAAAVNTSSSSVAPSNDYHGTLDATQVIGGAPNR